MAVADEQSLLETAGKEPQWAGSEEDVTLLDVYSGVEKGCYGTMQMERHHHPRLNGRRRRRRWRFWQSSASASASAPPSPLAIGTDWMSKLDDALPVAGLSIPGTHDSAAFTSSWPFIACQSLDVQCQLNAGIRYFDLRLGLRDDILELVHGPTYLGLTLEKLLETMYSWLEAHPREGVIVQLKRDHEDERATVLFSTAVTNVILKNTTRWRTANTTPLLGELRGRIQLFRRFTLHVPTAAYGIDVTEWHDNPDKPFTIHTWNGVSVTVQDHYKLADPAPLPDLIASKGGDVAGLLRRAADDIGLWNWYINFTSTYEFNIWYQISPREVAVGGYHVFRWYDGINVRLRNYLQQNAGKKRYGIVAMDFPEVGTDDLIDTIILANFENVDDGSGNATSLPQRVLQSVARRITYIWTGLSDDRLTRRERSTDCHELAATKAPSCHSGIKRICRGVISLMLTVMLLTALVVVMHQSTHFCKRSHHAGRFLGIHDC